jgi:phospholipase C
MPIQGHIKHVVVLMLENRSFDQIFGFRHGVTGLTGSEFNLLNPSAGESSGNPRIGVGQEAPFQIDTGGGPDHNLAAVNLQLFGHESNPAAGETPKNNGFAASYQKELLRFSSNPTKTDVGVVMQSFSPGSLPAIKAFADNFCLFDHWFCEVPSSTDPNRLYMHAATSIGNARNVFKQQFPDTRTIYNSVEEAGLTWATYDFDLNEVRTQFPKAHTNPENFRFFEPRFAKDVANNKLPNYSFIFPRFFNKNGPQSDEHAPRDLRPGDQLIAEVYNTLRSNTNLWNETALIVTYDEHGGFYDHVPPPSDGVKNPDGIDAKAVQSTHLFTPAFDFKRLGPRVPALLASPWVKKGTVVSDRFQHTSVLATVKKIFGLTDFLTKRDKQANTFEHLFAELQVPRSDTPKQLPKVKIGVAPPSLESIAPSTPGDLPLDDIQQEMLLGVLEITQPSHPTPPPAIPSTQADASDFIQRRLDAHFGPRAS